MFSTTTLNCPYLVLRGFLGGLFFLLDVGVLFGCKRRRRRRRTTHQIHFLDFLGHFLGSNHHWIQHDGSVHRTHKIGCKMFHVFAITIDQLVIVLETHCPSICFHLFDHMARVLVPAFFINVKIHFDTVFFFKGRSQVVDVVHGCVGTNGDRGVAVGVYFFNLPQNISFVQR